jgi:hypothetical protein
MTLSIPFTLPNTGTGPDIAGRRPAPGQQLTRPRLPVLALVSPPGHGSQPTPRGRPADRSGLWLRNAATGLGVLAAAAAAVSFTAQYRMVDATRHLPAIAALEAAIPDAAALVFASLGIALPATTLRPNGRYVLAPSAVPGSLPRRDPAGRILASGESAAGTGGGRGGPQAAAARRTT